MKTALIVAVLLLAGCGNPLDAQGHKAKKEEARREAEYKKKLNGRECMPPDREHDEYADVNNNMTVNGTPYFCTDEGKWIVNEKVMKIMAEREAHRRKLYQDLRTRVLTDKEFEEAKSYGLYLIIEPMVGYREEEKRKELDEAFLQQYRLREIVKK